MTSAPRRRQGFEIPATVHGYYLVEVPTTPPPYPLLVGFHGYGENAEGHLEHLVQLPGASAWLLCAVQALHPFYNYRTGEVVASWMTRFNRELAIQDNVAYVDAVVTRLRQDFPLAECRVYLGFSQGVAMAYRAAALGTAPCQGLVALGGDVPPELEEQDLSRMPPVLIARGRRDEWYNREKLERDLAVLAEKGVSTESFEFDGGHEWGEEFSRRVGAFLEVIRSTALATPK